MDEIIFTQENFESEVLKSEIPVLVDFYAEWCGPCKMMAPVISELAKEFKGKWKIGKCNVDDSADLSQRYGIQSIPSLLFFKNGEAYDKLMGFQSTDAVKAKLGNC